MNGPLIRRTSLSFFLFLFALPSVPFLSFADAPVCTPVDQVIGENTKNNEISIECTDIDGDIASYTVTTSVQHGTLTDPYIGSSFYVVAYTPDRGYDGTDSFSYEAVDAEGNHSGIVTVPVTVAPLPRGALSQLESPGGCFLSGSVLYGCSGGGRGFLRTQSAAMSPDGKHIYAAGLTDNSLAVIVRDASTGILSQPSGTSACYSVTGEGDDDGDPSDCEVYTALSWPMSVVVSPDGMNVYVAANVSNAIVTFDRNESTGILSNPRCISSDGSDGSGHNICDTGHAAALTGISALSISPDGRFLYGSNNAAVSILQRSLTTGDLSQDTGAAGCVSDAEATCTTSGFRSLGFITSLAMSGDGHELYTASYSGTVAMLNRNATTGALNQPADETGCVTEPGSVNCTAGRELFTTINIALSPDGRALYGVTDLAGIFNLTRDPDTGVLSQAAGAAGCVNTGGSNGCRDEYLVSANVSVSVDPSSMTVYTISNLGIGFAYLHLFSPEDGEGLQRLPSPFGLLSSSSGLALNLNPTVTLLSPDGRYLYHFSQPGVNVLERNELPVCTSATASIVHGHSGPIDLTCTDLNGDSVRRVIKTGPANGTLGTIDDGTGTVTYTPSSSFVGTDSFTFAGSDGYEGAVATVSVQVTNNTPVSSGSAVTLPSASAASISLPCTDADGNTLIRIIVEQPSHGTLGSIDQAGGTVDYTPESGYKGSDTFSFRCSDGAEQSSVSSVAVTVPDSPPTCTGSDITVLGGIPAAIHLLCSDVNGDALTWRISSGPATGTLSSFDEHNGSGEYTASNAGTDTIVFTASDGEQESAPATAQLHVGKAPLSVSLALIKRNHRESRCGRRWTRACRADYSERSYWGGRIHPSSGLSGKKVIVRIYSRRTRKHWKLFSKVRTRVKADGSFRIRLGGNLPRGLWKIKAVIPKTNLTLKGISRFRFLNIGGYRAGGRR